MFKNLKSYCVRITPFSTAELDLIDRYFEPKHIPRKQHVLEVGEICDFIAYVNTGCIRHYHIKNGNEITCDISMSDRFITEFNSFNLATKSAISFQALVETELFIIKKKKLQELYAASPKFEEFGRKIAEKVAHRNIQIAMSLASEKPAERYKNLLSEQPELFQKVPQKYIANFLGITPESLSRIRKRALI